MFTNQHLTRMEEILRDVCHDFECEWVESNGEADHVHLLITYPPKVTLTRLVNSLKGVTSRPLRQECPELAHHHWRAKKLWSASYYAGSAGRANLDTLKANIHTQDRPGARGATPPA